MNIRHTKWIFILIGVIYFLSWIDLIPDRLHPLFGRVDDFLLIAFLWWRYQQLKKKLSFRPATAGAAQEGTTRVESAKPFDPYKELEIPPSASSEEVETAYRRLMSQYHPDKVHHLGDALKKLAHERTLAIQKAYELLTSRKAQGV